MCVFIVGKIVVAYFLIFNATWCFRFNFFLVNFVGSVGGLLCLNSINILQKSLVLVEFFCLIVRLGEAYAFLSVIDKVIYFSYRQKEGIKILKII